MTIEYLTDTTHLRASNGSLERMVLRDGDPTEKSLLTLFEERAAKSSSATQSNADESRAIRESVLDQTDDTEDQRGLDRSMMRLGGNGF